MHTVKNKNVLKKMKFNIFKQLFKMTIVIGFIGGACVGKSLLSALVFAELKMKHHNVELVQEFAKQLVWQNRLDELNNQYQVTMEQYHMIKPLDNCVEYVVCDSPLLLGLFYNRYNTENVSNVEKTQSMIINKMKEFKNIYIFLERNPEYPFTQEGRLQNEEQAKQVDIQMKQLLHEFDIPYLSVVSSKDSVSKIIDYIFTSNQI